MGQRQYILTRFAGLRADAAPHLVGAGGENPAEFQDLLNCHTRDGSLNKRRGWTRTQEYPDPLAVAYWPTLLYNFGPHPGLADDVMPQLPPAGDDPEAPTPPPSNGSIAQPLPWTPGNPGSVSPGKHFPETPKPPYIPAEPVPFFVVTLPATVYTRTPFEIAVEAAFAEYAGEDIFTETVLVTPSTGQVSAVTLLDPDGDPVAFDDGWDNGEWAADVKLLEGAERWLRVLVRVGEFIAPPGVPRRAFNLRYSQAQARVVHPMMRPVLPDLVTPGQPFDLSLRAEALSGMLLEGYDNSGTDVTLEFYGTADGGTTWLPLEVTQDDGEALDLETGWAASLWADSVLLPEGHGCTQMRCVAKVDGVVRAQDECLLATLSMTIDLPDAIVTGEAFALRLTAAAYGDPETDFDGTGLELVWWGYDEAAEEWVTWEEPPELSGGGAIDPTTGWALGCWEALVELADRPEGLTHLRVDLYRSLVPMAYDTAAVTDGWLFVTGIYERQLMVGITDPWDEADPSNPWKLIDTTGGTEYTLEQYQAYVNVLAPHFVADPDWPQGDEFPSVFPEDYADGFTNVTDLQTAVFALRRIYLWPEESETVDGKYTTNAIPTKTTADLTESGYLLLRAQAEASFAAGAAQGVSTGLPMIESAAAYSPGAYGTYRCINLYRRTCRLRTIRSTYPTDIGGDVKWYGLIRAFSRTRMTSAPWGNVETPIEDEQGNDRGLGWVVIAEAAAGIAQPTSGWVVPETPNFTVHPLPTAADPRIEAFASTYGFFYGRHYVLDVLPYAGWVALPEEV